MSFIDSTYFTGDILLTNKTELLADISAAIDKYEKEILISLLGYPLYKLTIATPLVEPYKSLVEGAEFDMTFEGIILTQKWEGLKNSAKISLIAYYVYYKYQERNFIKPGAIGTVKPKTENADVVSPYPKMVEAWNKMIELYGHIPNGYFQRNSCSMFQPVAGSVYDFYPSAYNYMIAKINLFPTWIFTPLKTINPFGI